MYKILLTTLFWLVGSYGSAQAYNGAPPRIDLNRLERQIHQQVNHERQKQGLAPLVQDEKLTLIARNHSQDMARHNYFSHIDMQGEDPAARGKRQGWNSKKQIDSRSWKTGLSENLYLGSLYSRILTTTENGRVVDKEYVWNNPDQLVNTIVQGWMESPQHRKNIFSPLIDRQGIGVAISGNRVYVTEDLY